MAQFQINLLTPVLQNSVVDFYRDNLTSFSNNNGVYNYTYDENLTIERNAQETLKFKMVKYTLQDGEQVLNPFIKKLQNGSLIELIDKNNIKHWFTINDINYIFKPHNMEIEYTGISYFHSQMSKRETDYTITNDPSESNYIGAKKIDYWVNKIITECKVGYQYVPLQYSIVLTTSGQFFAKDDEYNNIYALNNLQYALADYPDGIIYTVRKNISDVDQLITFSISNSSAENALIELGDKYGLMLQVDYNTKCFWYTEIKNSTYTGLVYSPNSDLQTLSISQKADNLTTIFNVKGPTNQDEYISLLSSPTPVFSEWFASEEWQQTTYSENMFTNYVKNLPNYEPSNDDLVFAKQADRVPFLENKIFKSNYIQNIFDAKLFHSVWDKLYNTLRIVNGRLLVYRNWYYEMTKSKTLFIGNTLIPYCEQQGALMLNATINNPDVTTSDLDNLTEFYNRCAQEGTAATNELLLHTYNKQNTFATYESTSTVTEYGNKYKEALRNFYKNIYFFRETVAQAAANGESYQEPKYAVSLSQYWQAAYYYSLYCDYAIPQDWLRTDCWKTIIISGNTFFVNDEVVPNVQKVNIYYTNPENYNLPSDDPDHQDFPVQDQNWMNSFLLRTIYNTEAGDQRLDWKFATDTSKNYLVRTFEYVINTNTGVTWETLCRKCIYGANPSSSQTLPDNLYCQGYYQNFIRGYLESSKQEIFNKQTYDSYQLLLAENQQIWTDLFKDFGMVLLESSYVSNTATSSEELYEEAMIYYNEYEKPNNEYNLTVLDIHSIHNHNASIIFIGDQIALQPKDFYADTDNLKNILQQKLFIESIQYTLRKDKDIQYKVSTVSFYDKLLNRLIGLIV